VLSCDNLPANGALVRGVVLDLARAQDPGLADWIAREARFPATMVDRFTPATTAEDVARLEEAHGYHDPACVVHEAFRQWVIEEDFVSGRPAWEAGGAQFVADVSAHETMKLRCLNGTHSTLAYLGYLAGCETVADTVADPVFAQLCRLLWNGEILPTVPQPEGETLPAYCERLLMRYRDPSIRHRTWQIAMDGSRKLPQRILATIRDARTAGRLPEGLCLAVAGWMRYVGGTDEQGAPIDVRDPLAARLKQLSDAGGEDAAATVAGLLAVEEVFDPALAADKAFCAAVTRAYASLRQQGARATVAAFVTG
jgi:fructuronate reductase